MSIALGKTIKEIVNRPVAEFMKLYKRDKKQARKELSAVVSAANKRISRIEKSGISSPAVKSSLGKAQKFSVKGVSSPNEASSLMANLKQFLNLKTSTLKGAREYHSKIEKLETGWYDETGMDPWEAFRRLLEEFPSYGSDVVLSVLINVGNFDSSEAELLRMNLKESEESREETPLDFFSTEEL